MSIKSEIINSCKLTSQLKDRNINKPIAALVGPILAVKPPDPTPTPAVNTILNFVYCDIILPYSILCPSLYLHLFLCNFAEASSHCGVATLLY